MNGVRLVYDDCNQFHSDFIEARVSTSGMFVSADEIFEASPYLHKQSDEIDLIYWCTESVSVSDCDESSPCLDKRSDEIDLIDWCTESVSVCDCDESSPRLEKRNDEIGIEGWRSVSVSDYDCDELRMKTSKKAILNSDSCAVVPTKRKQSIEKVLENVKKVYAIVRKFTGSIGGNASMGPIYGELTMWSMQKVINLMKEHTEFTNTSLFVDVGSGIGKPNLHVAQDPGVKFSYGIEVEPSRWLLGIICLKNVLDAASKQVWSRQKIN